MAWNSATLRVSVDARPEPVVAASACKGIKARLQDSGKAARAYKAVRRVVFMSASGGVVDALCPAGPGVTSRTR